MISVLAIGITIKSRDYRLPAIFFMYTWLAGLSANIILFEGAIHFASPFWIIIINILVVYILGLFHSIITLIASIVVYIYYIEFGVWQNIKILEESGRQLLYISYIEIIFALLALGYLLWLILENSRKSDQELGKINQELKLQNELIRASNEEKTVMLKEIHHRVKNNLQVVTSMIRLQMGELDNPSIENKFKETISRIVAMAMIHEKMYQSEQINKISIENYVKDLARDVARTYSTGKDLNLEIKCKVGTVGMKTMVPLALLINELLSNSCKHAFVGVEKPAIQIELKENSEKELSLLYEDNGEWKTPKEANSLGLELIESFCEQLDGSKAFSKQPTRYLFTLKNLDY